MNRINIRERSSKSAKNSKKNNKKTNATKQKYNQGLKSQNKKFDTFTSPFGNKSWKEYKQELFGKSNHSKDCFKTQPSDKQDVYIDTPRKMTDFVKDETLELENSKFREINFNDEDITAGELFQDDEKISNYKNLLLTPKTINKIMRITKELVDSPEKSRVNIKTKKIMKDSKKESKKKSSKSRKRIIYPKKNKARRSNSEKRRVTLDTSNLKVRNIYSNKNQDLMDRVSPLRKSDMMTSSSKVRRRVKKGKNISIGEKFQSMTENGTNPNIYQKKPYSSKTNLSSSKKYNSGNFSTSKKSRPRRGRDKTGSKQSKSSKFIQQKSQLYSGYKSKLRSYKNIDNQGKIENKNSSQKNKKKNYSKNLKVKSSKVGKSSGLKKSKNNTREFSKFMTFKKETLNISSTSRSKGKKKPTIDQNKKSAKKLVINKEHPSAKSERLDYSSTINHSPKVIKMKSTLVKKSAQTQTHNPEMLRHSGFDPKPQDTSLTYDRCSQGTPRKSAPTAFNDALDTHQKNLLNYLLDERKSFITQVEEQNKTIQDFKEEIRKVKTLSQYYPDNRDLIIEEGDCMKDSTEDEEEEIQRNEVMIASSSDLFHQNRNEAEIMALRGSYDSGRNDPLRKSSYCARTLSEDGGLKKGSSEGRSPQGAGDLLFTPIEIDRAMKKGIDPLRNSANGLDPLRNSVPVNPLRQTLRGDSTGGRSIGIPDTKSEKSCYKFEIAEGCDEEVKEIPSLFENFMRFLSDRKDEETLKFAEFTFSKIEKIFSSQQKKLKDTRTKNFSLVSIISDLKEQEKQNMINYMQEGRYRNFGHSLVNPKISQKALQSPLQFGSVMIPTSNEEWETLDLRNPDYTPEDQRGENLKIKIPENLKKFNPKKAKKQMFKRIEKERGMVDEIHIAEKNSLINKMSEKRTKILQQMNASKISPLKPESPIPGLNCLTTGKEVTNSQANTQYFNVSINNNLPTPLVINASALNPPNPKSQHIPLSSNFSYFFMSQGISLNTEVSIVYFNYLGKRRAEGGRE